MPNAKLAITAGTLADSMRIAVPIFASTCTHEDTLRVAEALSSTDNNFAALLELGPMEWLSLCFESTQPVVGVYRTFVPGKVTTFVTMEYPSYSEMSIVING